MSDKPTSDNVVPIRPTQLRTREQLVDDVAGLLNSLEADFTHEDKLDIILKLQSLWPQLREEVQEELAYRFRNKLNLTPEKFAYALAAKRTKDIIRVLTPVEKPQIDFHKGEEFYLGFDGWLGRYANWCSYDETPVGYHFWSGLAILAAACRRSFWMIGKSEPLYPNMYLLLEGPAGCGKTTAISIASKILEQVNTRIEERALQANRPLDHLPFITTLYDRLTPVSFLEKLKGTRRRFLPVSAAADQNMFESCAIVIASELSTMLGDKRWGVNDMIALFTRAYDGELYEATYGRGDIMIPNLALTMLLGSTMESLREIVSPSTFRTGFMGARCLTISPVIKDRRITQVVPRDPIVEEELVGFLADLAATLPMEMRWDEEAKPAWDEWYRTHNRTGDDARIAGYFVRKQLQVRKLSILFSVSRGHQPWITLQDFESARSLLEHEEPRMFAAYINMLKGAHTDLVEYVQRTLARGPLARTEVYRRMLKQSGDGKLAKEVLQSMREAGMMVEYPEPRPAGSRGPARTMCRLGENDGGG